MLSVEVKEQILKYSRNLSRDADYIKRSFELFQMVLEIAKNDSRIESIEKDIENSYNAIKEGDDGPSLLSFNRFEPFMKVIYFIIHPEKFTNKAPSISLNDCISTTELIPSKIFNKIKFSDIKERKDILDPNHPINNIENEKNPYYPYMIAYWVRNDVAHLSSQLPTSKYHKYYESILKTYYDVCNKYSNLILSFSINKLKYPESIIKEYENKGFYYIKTSQNLTANKELVVEFGTKNVDITKLYLESRFKKIKVTGYAGIGKSSLLQYIQYNEMKEYIKNKNEKKLPVIIPLIMVDNNKLRVEDLLCTILTTNMDSVTSLLEQNKLNLYFDGVNEIRIKDKEERYVFLNYLENFIDNYSANNHVIVTDRDDNAYSICNEYEIYPKFIIREFNDQEIINYINKNCLEDYKKDILNKINDYKVNSKAYYEKLKQPFYLLQFINYFINNHGEIDLNLNITREYINSIVKREENEKKDPTAKYIIGALKYLAKYKYDNPSEENILVEENDLCVILNEYKNNILGDSDAYKSKEFIDLMMKMSLLKKDGLDRYSFADESYFKVLGV